jgi:hypothetical protein
MEWCSDGILQLTCRAAADRTNDGEPRSIRRPVGILYVLENLSYSASALGKRRQGPDGTFARGVTRVRHDRHLSG